MLQDRMICLRQPPSKSFPSFLTYDSTNAHTCADNLWIALLTDRYNNVNPAPDSCGRVFFEDMTRALARIFAFEKTEQAQVPEDLD